MEPTPKTLAHRDLRVSQFQDPDFPGAAKIRVTLNIGEEIKVQDAAMYPELVEEAVRICSRRLLYRVYGEIGTKLRALRARTFYPVLESTISSDAMHEFNERIAELERLADWRSE